MADNSGDRGVYVLPAKRIKTEKLEPGSEDHQKYEWRENKKKITGLINRANKSNVNVIVRELCQCNLIRYKGLFASALIKAQEASSVYTDVYAALLAVINSQFKSIGKLVVDRLILDYRRYFSNNNKPKCLAIVKFIAQLTNQEVVDEVLGFQIISHLINKPTPSSIEIVVTFLKECGAKLEQLNSLYLSKVFKTLRDLSLENDFDSRTHDLIEFVHIMRRDRSEGFDPSKSSLDLIDESDKFTHTIELHEPTADNYQLKLNYFTFDPDWAEHEATYDANIRKRLQGQDSSDDTDSEDDSEDEDEEDDDDEDKKEKAATEDDKKLVVKIEDNTQRDVIEFRKLVYSIIRSSITHEEVVHKLLKAKIPSELNEELCQMIIDFCGQVSHYETILGLVASKFCQINRREFAPKFEKIFEQFYETVHRFEPNKMRNITKFYAHLLTTESIDWSCLSCLELKENVTTSAGRIFIMFLFKELVSVLSLKTLIEYIKEPAHENAFSGLFPKDQEQDIRFAINFFTCCGLGQLTEDLRQELVSRQ